MGGVKVLSDEEEDEIVRYIVEMAKAHYPLTRDELALEVKKILDDNNRHTRFKDNLPGRVVSLFQIQISTYWK